MQRRRTGSSGRRSASGSDRSPISTAARVEVVVKRTRRSGRLYFAYSACPLTKDGAPATIQVWSRSSIQRYSR
jgi:hypothetical protein